MKRVLITGSSEGLGLMTGSRLAKQGHAVVLHARSAARARDARAALPQVQAVVVGDVSTLSGMHAVASQANAIGRFDAVIHNVGLGYREPQRVETVDGLSQLWAVNVLAPYVLTALMQKPDRLIYLSSGMHLFGSRCLDDLQWSQRRWNGGQAYSDSKFQDVLLAFGVARRWSSVRSNAVSPGWVATRMGGPGAPDRLDQAHLTQAWLATADDTADRPNSEFLYHKKPDRLSPQARDHALQNRLFDECREISRLVID
jgi:NAD(P)-dependent dehydrogenase (short-subunit alcohol dehydrogenase family)